MTQASVPGQTLGPVSLFSQQMSQHAKGVVYGPNGVGKTTMLATSQRFRTLILDIDRSMDGAKSYIARHGLRRDLVTVWPITGKADFFAAMQHVQSYYGYYDLIVFDTASELQRVFKQNICESRKLLIPDQQAWGALLLTMENTARWCRSLPLHVFWVCHEIERTDPAAHRLMFQPNFEGAFKTEYGKHFGEIWRYSFVDQQVRAADGSIQLVTNRVLQCQRNQFVHAKDRSLGLDMYETYLNIDYLFDKMTAAIQASGEAAAAYPEQVVA